MSGWWTPAQAGVVPDKPWLSPEVTQYLELLLKPDWTVLEHGAGGSTLWFSQRVRRVVSVEHNAAWYAQVGAKAQRNVKLVLHLADTFPIIAGKYDLILIDGEPVEHRRVWLEECEKYLRKGGIIVLDNYNRPEYAEAEKVMADKYHHITFTAPVGKYLNTRFYFTGGKP